jgi:hypothetical protein
MAASPAIAMLIVATVVGTGQVPGLMMDGGDTVGMQQPPNGVAVGKKVT